VEKFKKEFGDLDGDIVRLVLAVSFSLMCIVLHFGLGCLLYHSGFNLQGWINFKRVYDYAKNVYDFIFNLIEKKANLVSFVAAKSTA
jgi:hypothetical protein